MKKIFTLFILTITIYAADAQPFATGKRTQVFTDNSRSNREISTDIYYPASSAGTNVPLVAGTTKFPVVVFGHGFLIASSAYKWLADSLVKTGYIVAFPNTEGGILPSHLDFGLDLAFLCGRITSLNDSAGSFLYQRVIKKAAVAGHSMGGGASFLAAATLSSSINAVFNFAAAETTPPASVAAFLDLKPTLVLSGSADCIAQDSVQEAMYDNVLPFIGCKTYVNITNASHCQFANNNLVCIAGQFAAGCGFTSLSTNALMTKTMSLVSPFLDYYLKGICTRGEAFLFNYNNLTGVTEKKRSCLPQPSCGPLPVKLSSFTGNVKNDKVNLYWNTSMELNVSRIVVDRSVDGINFTELVSVLPKGSEGQGASYSAVDPYPYAGVNFYRLRIIDIDGSKSYSDIIKLVTSKKPLAVTKLYPNPVTDVLNLQLQSEKRQVVNAAVYDLSGKQLKLQVIELNNGFNEATIRLTDLAGGSYFIQLKSLDGSSAGTYKVVKN